VANAKLLARVEAYCTELADVVAKTSHGTSTWFTGGRQFAAWADNHHGDGRLALWLAAPEGAQAMLVEADAESYFVPPYVGPRGWIGVRLDRSLAWNEIAAAIDRAHAAIAAKRPARTRKPAPRGRAARRR
jgi:hypothetical protein